MCTLSLQVADVGAPDMSAPTDRFTSDFTYLSESPA